MNGHHTQRPAPPRLAVFSRMSIHSLVVLMTQNICVMRKSRQFSHATSVLYWHHSHTNESCKCIFYRCTHYQSSLCKSGKKGICLPRHYSEHLSLSLSCMLIITFFSLENSTTATENVRQFPGFSGM